MRTLTLLIITGLALTYAIRAEDTPAAGGDRPLPEFAKRFDKDGDGKLSESERQAMKEAIQAHRGGGRGEGGGFGKGDPQRREALKEKLLKKFDTNGDGKLDDDEKKAAMEAMKEFRAKHQGQGGQAGVAGGGGGGRGGEMRQKLIQRFDKNGDGKLDDDEKKAAMDAIRERLDGAGKSVSF